MGPIAAGRVDCVAAYLQCWVGSLFALQVALHIAAATEAWRLLVLGVWIALLAFAPLSGLVESGSGDSVALRLGPFLRWRVRLDDEVEVVIDDMPLRSTWAGRLVPRIGLRRGGSTRWLPRRLGPWLASTDRSQLMASTKRLASELATAIGVRHDGADVG